jgi:hypothetical protein
LVPKERNWVCLAISPAARQRARQLDHRAGYERADGLEVLLAGDAQHEPRAMISSPVRARSGIMISTRGGLPVRSRMAGELDGWYRALELAGFYGCRPRRCTDDGRRGRGEPVRFPTQEVMR